jgi:hypothetical protein
MSEHTGKIVRDSGLFEYSFFAFAVQPAFREVFPIFYKVFPDSTDPAHGERIDLIKNFISEYEKLNLFGPDNTYTDKKKNEYLDGPSSDIDEYLCISRANVTKYGCQLHSMDPCPVVSDRVIECLGIPIHSQIFGNHQTLMRLAVKKRMEMEFAEVLSCSYPVNRSDVTLSGVDAGEIHVLQAVSGVQGLRGPGVQQLYHRDKHI